MATTAMAPAAITAPVAAAMNPAPVPAFSVAAASAEQTDQWPLVATAGDAARVELAPPGWGAKVTLTVSATPFPADELPPPVRRLDALPRGRTGRLMVQHDSWQVDDEPYQDQKSTARR